MPCRHIQNNSFLDFDAATYLPSVEHQKHFHRCMTNALVSVCESVIRDQPETQYGCLRGQIRVKFLAFESSPRLCQRRLNKPRSAISTSRKQSQQYAGSRTSREGQGFLDQKSPSCNHQTSCGMIQDGLNLVGRYPRKPIQELCRGRTRLKVFKKRCYGNPSATEHPSTTQLIR